MANRFTELTFNEFISLLTESLEDDEFSKYIYNKLMVIKQNRMTKECEEVGHFWTWMPNDHHACLRCGKYEEIQEKG